MRGRKGMEGKEEEGGGREKGERREGEENGGEGKGREELSSVRKKFWLRPRYLHQSKLAETSPFVSVRVLPKL